MLNLYYFTDRALKVGFKNLTWIVILLIMLIPKLTILPNFPEFGIEVRYIN